MRISHPLFGTISQYGHIPNKLQKALTPLDNDNDLPKGYSLFVTNKPKKLLGEQLTIAGTTITNKPTLTVFLVNNQIKHTVQQAFKQTSVYLQDVLKALTPYLKESNLNEAPQSLFNLYQTTLQEVHKPSLKPIHFQNRIKLKLDKAKAMINSQTINKADQS